MKSSSPGIVLPSPAPCAEPTHGEIAAAAAALWRRMGCPQGIDARIWREAERQLLGRLHNPDSGDRMGNMMDELIESYTSPAGRSTTSL